MSFRDTPWPVGTPAWVDLTADDAATAAAFYHAVLGWTVPLPDPAFGGYASATLAGRRVAGIGLKPGGAGSMPSRWQTYLAVDDIAASAAAVAAAGGQVLIDPMPVGTLGFMAAAVDPTGAPFSLWQAGEHVGFGVYNEAGAVVWNELHTGDDEAAQRFYGAVFGHTFTTVADDPEFSYWTFHTATDEGPGGSDAVGGMMRTSESPNEPGPFWLTYFAVDDPDATVAAALAHGGSVMMPPADTPYGRIAGLTGPEGEAFCVMRPNPM